MTGEILTKEMIENCRCSQAEIDEAVRCGEKVEFETEDGKITAYLYGGKTYIVDIQGAC